MSIYQVSTITHNGETWYSVWSKATSQNVVDKATKLTALQAQEIADKLNGISESSIGRDSIYDALKAHSKEKFTKDREKFLNEACESSDGQWIVHTPYHWSRYVAGQRLDYWPSRKKYQYEGNVMRGDVMKFIAQKETP